MCVLPCLIIEQFSEPWSMAFHACLSCITCSVAIMSLNLMDGPSSRSCLAVRTVSTTSDPDGPYRLALSLFDPSKPCSVQRCTCRCAVQNASQPRS
uniref:Uncharacterized protein n=1 Tax=Arundo donax TaxID=35708 RepID=A0A0A8YQL8_ARUDO